jgi:hypothetical protein
MIVRSGVMGKPRKSDLANIQVEFYKEFEDEMREYAIDAWVDKEGVDIIFVHRFENGKWIAVYDDELSDEDLDKVTDLLLTDYYQGVESEPVSYEDDLWGSFDLNEE